MKKFYLVLCVTLGAIHLVLAQGFQLGWHLTGGGPSVDFIHEIVQDKSGNIVVTGAFSGTVDFDPGPGVFNLSIDLQHTKSDAFVAKYTPNGSLLWAKKFGSAQNVADAGLLLAIDDTNNIYMVGEYQGDIQFLPGGPWYNWGNAPGKPRLFLVKLDSTGATQWGFGWQNTTTNGEMRANRFWEPGKLLFFGSDNNLYFAGRYSGKMDFDPRPGIDKVDSAFSTSPWGSAFLLKISPQGFVQRQKSIKSINNNSGLWLNEFSMGPNGDVWLCATAQFEQFFLDSIPLNSLGSDDDGFIIKFDTSLTYQWHLTHKRVDYKRLRFLPNGIRLAASYGRTGWTTPVDLDPGPGIDLNTVAGTDIAIIEFDTNWNYLSSVTIHGDGSREKPTGFEVLSGGDMVISGYFSSTNMDFDPGPGVANFVSKGGLDAFVVRLDSSYNFVSAATFGSLATTGSSAEDMSNGLKVLNDHEIVLVGQFRDIIDIDPDTGIMNIATNGQEDFFMLSLNTCNKTYTTYADTACGSFALPGSGLVVTQSGTYLDTLSGKLECDSILTIQLTMLPDLNPTVSQNIDGLLASTTDSTATFAWLDCQTGQLVPGSTSNPWMPPYNGTFAAVTYAQGCQDTSACYSINNVGLGEPSTLYINLFPNPTNAQVYVRSNQPILQLRLFNLVGQELLNTTHDGAMIDLSGQSTGMYLLKIDTPSGIAVERVVKMQ
jgi:hypothetical protein